MIRTAIGSIAAAAVLTFTVGTAHAASDDTVPSTDETTTTVEQHLFPRQDFTADCSGLTIRLRDYPTGQTFTLYVDDVQVHAGGFDVTLDLVKPWSPGPHTWTLDLADQGVAPVQRIIGGFNLLCGTTPTTTPPTTVAPTTVPSTTVPPGVCSDTANGGTVVCPEVTSTTTTVPATTDPPVTAPATTVPVPVLPSTGSGSGVLVAAAAGVLALGLGTRRAVRRR